MRRKDFVIGDIPAGYRVYDVDLTPAKGPVTVLGHSSDQELPVVARWGATEINLPDNSLWWHNKLEKLLLSAVVRAAGDERLVVVLPRVRSDREINGWVWDSSANVEVAFHAGDGINDVLASQQYIVPIYFDEGIFGDDPLSREGLVVFDAAANMRMGYYSHFSDEAVHVADCYCASWVDKDRLAVLMYNDGFPIVVIDMQKLTQEVWKTPDIVHGSDAISFNGDRVFFYSPYDTPGQETGLHDSVLAWQLGAPDASVVGKIESSNRVHGLPGGRFLAVNPDGYTILSFD